MKKIKDITVEEFKELFSNEEKATIMKSMPYYKGSKLDGYGVSFVTWCLDKVATVELYKHCDYFYIATNCGSFRTKLEVIELLGLLPKTTPSLEVAETSQSDLDKMSLADKDARITYLEQTLNKIIRGAVKVNLKWKSVPAHEKYGTYASDAVIDVIKTALEV